MPVLSIITVLKDDECGLRQTMESIVASSGFDRAEVEWIIIDSSTDPESVKALVSQSALEPTLIWEPPSGIYEAMNTGLNAATGQYVYFLNAGDRLRDASVLASVVQVLKEETPGWLYGQVAFLDGQGREVIPPAFDFQQEKRALFARGRFPPHQGTVTRRTLLQSMGGFDTKYRVAADYAAALQLSLIAEPFEMANVIAEFTEGGVSTRDWKQSLREFHQARVQVFNPHGTKKVAEFLRTIKLRVARGLYESWRRRLP